MRSEYYDLRKDALTLAVKYVGRTFNGDLPVLSVADLFKCYLEEDMEGVVAKRKEIKEELIKHHQEREELEKEYMAQQERVVGKPLRPAPNLVI